MKTRSEQPSRNRRGVVICGAYGMSNAGDDAVLTAITAGLRRLDRDMPVTVIARQAKRTAGRYGDVTVPMDEALVLCAVDISGRGYLGFDLPVPTQKIGTFDTELVEEFFMAFARESGVTLHLKALSGRNAHHLVEGAFKAFARAMRSAVAVDPALSGAIPSTKGVL